jgi:hypothetical protein
MDKSRPFAPTHPTRPNTEIGHYYDPTSRCWIVIARPSEHRRLWVEYLQGARTSYRGHGVENVLDYDQVVDGHSTTLFFTASTRQGRIVGGMRAQGPYLIPSQAHALAEWAGRPGSAQLQHEIALRIPAGIVEMKTGWVADDVDRRSELTAALARFFIHTMALFGVRYAMCTVAAHAVKRWQSTGGVLNSKVAEVAYPDERYLTRLMLWDKEHYSELADADQLAALRVDAAQLVSSRSLTSDLSPLAA